MSFSPIRSKGVAMVSSRLSLRMTARPVSPPVSYTHLDVYKRQLGIQAEDADELAELGVRLDRAGRGVLVERDTACCHARSDKAWSIDPQGTRCLLYTSRCV